MQKKSLSRGKKPPPPPISQMMAPQGARQNQLITFPGFASWRTLRSNIDVDNITINILQEAKEPDPVDPEETDSIAPDMTGMNSNAKTLASKMVAGWNLGNSLEATGGETSWGNPLTTEEIILAVKDAGFNAIRIPCAWNRYLENQENYTIKESWLERVKEVVDYCVDNDIYAIFNVPLMINKTTYWITLTFTD